MANWKSCGNELNGAKFCASCGTPVEEVVQSGVAPQQPVQGQPVQQPMAQQPMQGQPVAPGQAMPGATLPADNLGLAGFICGIIGFLCCSFCTIPGLICSIMSMNNVKSGKVDPKNKWMGIVGLVLSILGILVWIFNIVNVAANY